MSAYGMHSLAAFWLAGVVTLCQAKAVPGRHAVGGVGSLGVLAWRSGLAFWGEPNNNNYLTSLSPSQDAKGANRLHTRAREVAAGELRVRATVRIGELLPPKLSPSERTGPASRARAADDEEADRVPEGNTITRKEAHVARAVAAVPAEATGAPLLPNLDFNERNTS